MKRLKNIRAWTKFYPPPLPPSSSKVNWSIPNAGGSIFTYLKLALISCLSIKLIYRAPSSSSIHKDVDAEYHSGESDKYKKYTNVSDVSYPIKTEAEH